ncbi:UDP-N-acetylglucosamine--N-acetylmuramyl-(pentapeptide) pyrophosphoryl-undecaprenol N-acetylglucosamine transferase [Rhodovastum atsumiense]|uniref:UDP-N-acetylglucosamine--N-acetylmuramyl-(pentapeptide) pyrophosphoryl-undecaprenol N-acetylglucosamine transferase n=1 Tax=Rhodovastum atsumiense TaxID=504468 RepID=A0A5M6IZ10_9PROT|nr:undecaprenyldiphospho-muramoylpentapeptide beta-N-acetylglucosaminyltransferase [Rhodovastum atsumiense]KAA5613586.1 undecaprenyldiphospho-muramoylpentapeptide beta-N-acetylglucosaminyltransferase [Rhodovastum atsumiense]CAH2599485.1 UDP-N-acetylglucosamine--N-acetylmuramyl-(pentapeptide) pyrophosphoryl-undecaprenol N-acetylglucosamine transferase [Rhodovastum atsumiense]
MRGPAPRLIVIAAGGTGGHFFPAEALAAALSGRGHRIALMTDARSGGLDSPSFAGGERFVLRGAGIAGRGAWRGLQAVGQLAAGTLQARGILARLDAAAVVGFGGYPAVAPVLAARLLRRRPRVLLHEQNAVLGRANRVLARLADGLALSHAPTSRLPRGVRTTLTGNPVRPAVAALAGHPYAAPEGVFRLVVIGGSLGARVFSDIVPAALRALPATTRARLHVTQQCRSEDLDRVRAVYNSIGIVFDLQPFFADIAGLLSQAHLVVARAGASTIAELGVIGRPAVLVPLPGAIDDHQTENARALVAAGGAWMMPQSEFGAETLAQRIETLLAAPAILSRAAQAAAGCGIADAASRLADLVEQTIAQDSVS